MFSTESKIRVRYSETDQMGYVYYGNYAAYYEVARTEMMRTLGISYKEMEEKGCLMPMVDMFVKYLNPACYDDLLRVKTTMLEMPCTRIKFSYEIYNDATNQLLNMAETTLAFIDSKTYKPMRAPQWFLDIINEVIIKIN